MKPRIHLLMTTAFRLVMTFSLALFVQSAGAQLPIFQYAIFYNLNMEFDPTPKMTVNGPVFCNQSIWTVAILGLTFNSTVQAVGTVITNTTTDPIANNGYGRTGTTPVNFASQPTSGNQPLTIPVGDPNNISPTNAEAILNLPPVIGGQSMGAPNVIAYTTTNQVYLFNECDLIISNSVFGTNGVAFRQGFTTGTTVNTLATNFTVWFQDQYNTAALQKLTNDLVITKNGLYTGTTNLASTNILYKGFSFLTNVSFYDYREGKQIQAVQIDIAKFNKWLTNNLAVGGDQGPGLNSTSLTDNYHGIGSIYVYSSVPLTATQLPAVRVANGSQLPAQYPGLTVATPFPIYVLGNYNVQIPTDTTHNDIGKTDTTYTEPAALLGDAITILSTTWSDSYNSSTAETARNAGDTTVNAAFLEGIVPSNPNIANNYSGGVENALRYVEDWTSQTNTYNGSIAVMFPSIYATNVYQTNPAYYNPPSRNWAFDLNFKNSNDLPPLTPSVGYEFPVILAQPHSQSAVVGNNPTFSITASSFSPLSFQWNLNGTNIPGATDSEYYTNYAPLPNGLYGIAQTSFLYLTNVQSSQAGRYSVTITNTFGSVTSSNAVLSVYPSAAATFNTFSLSATNGFQFSIAGVPGYNYAVQGSTNLIDWISLITNVSPFNFTDTNIPRFQQRFYRTIYLP